MISEACMWLLWHSTLECSVRRCHHDGFSHRQGHFRCMSRPSRKPSALRKRSFWLHIMPLLRVESLSQEGLLVMLDVNHMVGRYTRQRWLNPQDAHTWHRCLHHDGIAKLDTVHGGQTEAAKSSLWCEQMRPHTTESNHKPHGDN